jgi:hypothetical protein
MISGQTPRRHMFSAATATERFARETFGLRPPKVDDLIRFLDPLDL